MKANEYQKKCMRTADKTSSQRQLYCCLGLAGESGELIDHIKKVFFHGHNVNINYIKEEVGDILWYLSVLINDYDLKLEDVMKYNIEKLKKRYPDGFSSEASINRKN